MFYKNLFLNIVLILFPIFIYLLYVAYSNNHKVKKNNLFFDFINITLIYLLFSYKRYFDDSIYLLLLNIPLILSFLKKRTITAIALTIIIVLIIFNSYNFSLIFLIFEYLLYFWLYYFFYKKTKDFEKFICYFILIKGAVLSFEIFYILPLELTLSVIIVRIFIILLLFYCIISLVVMLLEKGENILSLNKVLKELEKEKLLRSSLFKITHEIKNPLAVCKGYLDMMNYNEINKVEKYNNIIKQEVERSLDLMDDFSDYTKVKVNLEIMDINVLLEDVILSMQSLFLTKNIKLKNNVKDTEIFIMGDYNRLKQVFVNLLKNSVEAILNFSGEIEINITELFDIVIISIKDNGNGMDDETLKRIGETFFTTKEKGTGLGVTLSNEIIQLHEGTIKYESKKDKGTKVTITLHKKN